MSELSEKHGLLRALSAALMLFAPVGCTSPFGDGATAFRVPGGPSRSNGATVRVSAPWPAKAASSNRTPGRIFLIGALLSR